MTTVPTMAKLPAVMFPSLASGLPPVGSTLPPATPKKCPVNLHDAGENRARLGAFAPGSSDGLIVTASPLAVVHYHLIVDLASRCTRSTLRAFLPLATAKGGLMVAALLLARANEVIE